MKLNLLAASAFILLSAIGAVKAQTRDNSTLYIKLQNRTVLSMRSDGSLLVDGDKVKLTDKQRKAIRDYMHRSTQ